MKYRDAGVDLTSLGAVKKRIKRLAKNTFNRRVLSQIGLFGGLFDIGGFRKPVLVASVDGVGTKVKVAALAEYHRGVGIDIVNHCINDIFTLGARPLFMLDYIAYSELEPRIIAEVVGGMTHACAKEGVALIGGETAMMPDCYQAGDYDLVGFVIGVIEKGRALDGRKIRPGDAIIGFRSNGLHTNGFSLAREVLFRRAGYTVDTYLPELKNTVGKELLKPHRSYRKKLEPVLHRINGLAHITGGGFYENIARVLPARCRAIIDKQSWSVPLIFNVIQQHGNIGEREMYNVFNMGIGMVAIADTHQVAALTRIGGIEIGHIERGNQEVIVK